MNDGSPLLLYDGSCGFCASTVQFVLRRDVRKKTLRFASLQGETGASIRRRHPQLDAADSVVWLDDADDASPRVRSAAALRVLSYLGGVWAAAAVVAGVVPVAVRDQVYDLVARHRHRLSRNDPACVVPTPDERARFID
jgi:predicted DCC family thiol-disulfide oxidoreductase YuxK